MKEKRGDRGLSLREASRLSGVSHTHIRDIEDGRSIPSFAMVMRFLKAYTVDMEDFLRETGYLPANAEPEHTKDIKSKPLMSMFSATHSAMSLFHWLSAARSAWRTTIALVALHKCKMFVLVRFVACAAFSCNRLPVVTEFCMS